MGERGYNLPASGMSAEQSITKALISLSHSSESSKLKFGKFLEL